MSSQAKPKKLSIVCSDGREYGWLAKRGDDLRKDLRLMDIQNLLNTVLRRDAESRKKGLSIRTYSLIPLGRRTGLIEWVDGYVTLRSCLDSQWAHQLTYLINDKFKARWEAAVKEESGTRTRRKETPESLYNTVLKQVPPVFSRWQEATFGLDPFLWHEARQAYTRSAAVTSMVGFVLGLGDRHGENILVDAKTGQLMHIDFDCMFWKASRVFEVPERVPFRLTQNVRDGFGVTDYEGGFRKTSESTLRLLRTNWESVRPVLESLLYDPVFDHIKRADEQKNKAQLVRRAGRQDQAQGKDEISEDPAKVLSKIRSIVRGESCRNLELLAHWNIRAPKVDRAHYEAGAEHRSFTLSVEGQVQEQIEEATSILNLSRMYIGWNPYL